MFGSRTQRSWPPPPLTRPLLGLSFDFIDAKKPDKSLGNTMMAGLVRFDPEHGKSGEVKRLTFGKHGHTNSVVVRIDGKDYVFGNPQNGRWQKKPVDVERGKVCAFEFMPEQIVVVQVVIIVFIIFIFVVALLGGEDLDGPEALLLVLQEGGLFFPELEPLLLLRRLLRLLDPDGQLHQPAPPRRGREPGRRRAVARRGRLEPNLVGRARGGRPPRARDRPSTSAPARASTARSWAATTTAAASGPARSTSPSSTRARTTSSSTATRSTRSRARTRARSRSTST